MGLSFQLFKHTCRGRPGSVRFANGPGDVSGGSTTFLVVHGRRRRRMTTTVRKVRSGVKLGIKQALTAVAAFGFVATGAASASAGDHVVASAFNLASRLSIGVGFDCKNHPGPSITLGDGQIALGDIEGRLTFANNVKLRHEADADIIAVSPFLTFGTAVKIPKQPSQPADAYGSDFSGTGVGGNPWIYAILNDAKDQPLKKLDGSELGPIL